MIKNIFSLGSSLNKVEQQRIHRGRNTNGSITTCANIPYTCDSSYVTDESYKYVRTLV
ncbi:hypothetical protein [Tenacibaculum aiptasiae]|uniref:hypothetical protein n=1 Tax=Tenacibaculum aiptasiae TaxID=426481 RepID=UPI0015881539|nr:hypothetical protein [Tenacibaculum aiptasiae]